MPEEAGRRPLGHSRTDAELKRLADAFGSPTRHDIYRHLSACGAPVGASELAARFGLHRTAARTHLERLVELGLASTATYPRPGGGLPARSYAAVEARLEIAVPPRRYEDLAGSLLELLTTLDGGSQVRQAAVVGRTYGELTASEIVGDGVEAPVQLSLSAFVDWLERSGYEATTRPSGGSGAVVEIGNCVYRELSLRHPELVCAFDRGMFCGMLGVDASAHQRTRALCAGDSCCRHEFRL